MFIRLLKKTSLIWAAVLCATMATPTAIAQDDDPNKVDLEQARLFVNDLAERGMAVLNDTTLTQVEREDGFRDLLRQGFDLDGIGRIVLGRYRRTADREQVEEFDRIFPEFVLKVYANRLTEFGDEELVIGNAIEAGRRDAYVRSQVIRPDGPPVAADWRIRVADGELKIVDLRIEGISMVLTQRDEFSSRIASAGMEALLNDIRARADDPQLDESQSATE